MTGSGMRDASAELLPPFRAKRLNEGQGFRVKGTNGSGYP
jgi:hypothetical protein